MADYTVQQYRDAAKKALAAGDTAAAQRLIAAGRALEVAPPPQPEQPERGFGQMLYENIIGSGAVDTPGERLGQYIRGGTAAVARGIADVPALPANIAQLGAMGVEKALGMEEPSMVSRALGALPETREMLAAIPVIGPESQYQAPGLLGEYISTAGEFAGGAGASAGPRAMLRYGAAPGVASEAAGQATEGTALEPYARTAAALAAPLATNVLENVARRAITPIPNVDPVRSELAKVLEGFDIPLTAGQRTGSETLRRIEGSTARGAQFMEDQAEAFTSAALKSIGVTAKRATPDVLDDASKQIGGVFNSVTKGVNVAPDAPLLTRMSNALQEYRQLAPSAEVAPIFRNINAEMVKSFRSGNPIPASQMTSWRSQLSKLTTSSQPATREAAKSALEAIDDSLTRTLTSMGRADDVARLSQARSQWRDLLAIEGAASRAGEGTALGLLSPSQLRNEIVRQGRTGYTRGTREGLADLTRAAEGVMKPLPTTTAGGVRSIELLPTFGASGVGASLGALAGGPAGAAIGGAMGAAAPSVLASQAMTPTVQRYLANQMVGSGPSVANQRMLGLLPGLLSQ